MLCWSNAIIRREVLLNLRNPGSGVGTAKEFAEWLFVGKNEKAAGVLVAVQSVNEKLGLSLYGR